MSSKDGAAKRAAIYCRISADKTGAGLGVERQEQDCRELADRLGWTIEVVRTDNDISAFGGKKRPGYLALLEDIKAGRIDGVLVWHTDRLHRSPVELEAYIRACEPGHGRPAVETQTVKAGLLDLATPTGRMVARTLGNIAHFEVEHMIERMKAAKKQMRADGRKQGGPRPYGYRRDGNGSMIVVEEEAAEIRAAATRVLAGEALTAIARDMNERGVRTPTEGHRNGGKKWHTTSLRVVLSRASNAGLIEHDGQIIGPALWEPILDEGTWRGLKAIFADPSRLCSPPGPIPRRLLTGMLRCGVCKETGFGTRRTHVVIDNGRQWAYYCRRNCVSRRMDLLDEWVEWLVFERLSRPGAAAAFKPDVDHVELEGRRKGLRARLDELGTAFGNGDIDAQQMAAASRPLLAALKEADDAMAASFRGSVLDEAPLQNREQIEAWWARLPMARRRAIVQFLMEIVVYPTKGRPKPAGYRVGMPHPLDDDPKVLKVVWKTP